MKMRTSLNGYNLLILCLGLFCFSDCEKNSASSEPPAIPLDGRGGGVLIYCYQPVPNGLHQIYGINANGTENKKIINAAIGLNHHDVSPDGQKIVAVGYASQSTWSIYVFNFDGTGLTRLTTTVDVFDSEPAWSPDGARIVFTRIYPNQNYRNEIWIMNVDGSSLRYTGIEGFGARWSPDGTKIIFTNIGDWGPPGLKGSDILTSHIDGTNLQKMTNTPGDEWYPSWSPDGSKIVYHYSQDGKYDSNEIFSMSSDGTERQPLTNNTTWDGMARWSPNGSFICYNSDVPAYQHWEVYIMNSDGTGVRRVTSTSAEATAINPVWRPNVASNIVRESF